MALFLGTRGLLDYFTPNNVPGSAPFPERMVCPDHLLSHFESLTEPTQTHECFIAANNTFASASETSRETFDTTFATQTINAHIASGRIKASWESATDTLAVTASAIPSDRKTHASDFRTLINGKEVPFTRISEDKIAD